MKLISWNVNGIRALYNKGEFLKIFENQKQIMTLMEDQKNLLFEILKKNA